MATNAAATQPPAAPTRTPPLPESDEMELSAIPSAEHAVANTRAPGDAAPIADGKIAQRTYTMVRRAGADGIIRTYCIWIAVTDDKGKFLRYGNVNGPKFNESVTKLLEVTSQPKYVDTCDKIFAKGAGQISFNITSKLRNPDIKDPTNNETTTITFKNSTSATSLSLSNEEKTDETVDASEKQSERDAVSNFMTELLAIQEAHFLINPKGKSEVDPRSLFGGGTDDQDATLGADGKKIQTKTLDKAKDLTPEEQRDYLQRMAPPSKVPKVKPYPYSVNLQTLNDKYTTAKALKEHQGSPMFIPVERDNGQSVYLCLDKANKALYYYDPSTTHEIETQHNDRASRYLENSIYKGKSGVLHKALHDFCNTHGVQNLYAPTDLSYKNGSSNSHNGLQWFKHLSEQPNLSPENAFPKDKMGDIKIPMTPSEIAAAEAADASAASKKVKKPVETDDETDTDDDDEEEEVVGTPSGPLPSGPLPADGAAAPGKSPTPTPLTLAVAEAMIKGMNPKPSPEDAEKTKKWVAAVKIEFDKLPQELHRPIFNRWKTGPFETVDDELITRMEDNYDSGRGVNNTKIAARREWLHYLANNHKNWLLEPDVPEVLPPEGAAPAGHTPGGDGNKQKRAPVINPPNPPENEKVAAHKPPEAEKPNIDEVVQVPFFAQGPNDI